MFLFTKQLRYASLRRIIDSYDGFRSCLEEFEVFLYFLLVTRKQLFLSKKTINGVCLPFNNRSELKIKPRKIKIEPEQILRFLEIMMGL